MYDFIKEVVPVIKILNSVYPMAITSWIRGEGTHRTGLSIDLAPRGGPGYRRKLQFKMPNYTKDIPFQNKIRALLPRIRQAAPHLKLLGVENTHLHLSWKDFYPNQKGLLYALCAKRQLDGYNQFKTLAEIN